MRTTIAGLLAAGVPLLFAGQTAGVSAACPANLANGIDTPRGSAQLITVEAARHKTTAASLRTWRRQGGCWVPVAGPWTARVGWNGLADRRREGDGTTPTGVYRFGSVMYGNAPNPGVRYRYRRLTCGDWWNEDPTSPTYNTFRHVRCGARPPFRVTTPGLWQEKSAYRHFAVIEYNTRPVVPGRGSGIFLHAQTGSSTNGCISLPAHKLVVALRWLDPAKRPRIAIGTRASLSR
ncbi:MAG TPA: L,D-transpeptidase family protein [Gaiellaceae bacterium]|nr:L,D-transpeptidase family protein [Gaiellaceae bacterium]